jgi:hypothetical protein
MVRLFILVVFAVSVGSVLVTLTVFILGLGLWIVQSR